MALPQPVRIPALTGNSNSLSKYQREFNRLTQRIDELEHELTYIRHLTVTLQTRLYTEYDPLLVKYNQLRARLIRIYDRAHDRPETSRAEQRKLAELIRDLADELINRYGLEELQPLLDKYRGQPLGTEKTLDEVDLYSPLSEPVQNDEANGFDRETTYKSAKQQKREARLQAEERNITKAVRTLYVDLIKVVHPDREPDEQEKIRKTAIMQRVTEAYEKSDLLTLLQLQLEFNHIDQRHLEKLADNQLRYYNKILQQQVNELSQELAVSVSRLEALVGKTIPVGNSLSHLEHSLNTDIKSLKKSVKTLNDMVKILADPAQLKAWLRS